MEYNITHEVLLF